MQRKKINQTYFRAIIIFLLILAFSFILVGCASGDMSKGEPSYAPSDGSAGGTVTGDEDTPGEGEEPGSQVQIPAGQLTAAAYSDIVYKEFWNTLINPKPEQTEQPDKTSGIFSKYYENSGFISKEMIEVSVSTGTTTLSHVKVQLVKEQDIIYSSVTDKTGKAYLFVNELSESLNVTVSYTDINGTLVEETKPVESNIITFDNLPEKVEDENIIELMFVVDTTGSMIDELEYLKAEIKDVIERVTENTDATVYLALLFYRDHGDAYVKRYFDFTTDVAKQITNINKQSANGGGDFPEAVEVAFDEALKGSWTFDTSTKVIVHVADAPSHSKDYQEWHSLVKQAAAKGIKILTVASSGIDLETEFLFRSQSLLTNSHYVYLTDDSGIGGSHLAATVCEKPIVEYLNSCLVRLIKGYHVGKFDDPVYYGEQQ